MIYNYQYKAYPTTEQKLLLNDWLRTCRYWYNKMLGQRFDWWEQNRSYIDRCSLICHLPELKDKPTRFNQQGQLPGIKKDLVKVNWSGEHKNFKSVPANTLQEVCKRVDKAFTRFISGDSKGNRSGKPRFKNEKRYRSMFFNGFELGDLKVITKKYVYITLPKSKPLKVRYHRPIPESAKFKSALLIKKADGWYIQLCDRRSNYSRFPRGYYSHMG